MKLRKVLWLHGSHGVVLPVQYLKQINATSGDYLEVGMLDAHTIVVRKHIINQERQPDERSESVRDTTSND